MDLNLVHTDPKDEKKIIVSYYNTKNHSVLTKDISERELENFKNGISIYKIFLANYKQFPYQLIKCNMMIQKQYQQLIFLLLI